MSDIFPRVTKNGDWRFEVKLVSGTKLVGDSDEISAVANLTMMGSSVYVDSQLSKSHENLTKHDFLMIYEFCRQIGATHIIYDRIKGGKRRSKKLRIKGTQTQPKHLSLVQNNIDRPPKTDK